MRRCSSGTASPATKPKLCEGLWDPVSASREPSPSGGARPRNPGGSVQRRPRQSPARPQNGAAPLPSAGTERRSGSGAAARATVTCGCGPEPGPGAVLAACPPRRSGSPGARLPVARCEPRSCAPRAGYAPPPALIPSPELPGAGRATTVGSGVVVRWRRARGGSPQDLQVGPGRSCSPARCPTGSRAALSQSTPRERWHRDATSAPGQPLPHVAAGALGGLEEPAVAFRIVSSRGEVNVELEHT